MAGTGLLPTKPVSSHSRALVKMSLLLCIRRFQICSLGLNFDTSEGSFASDHAAHCGAVRYVALRCGVNERRGC